jgi:hypothetical protein
MNGKAQHASLESAMLPGDLINDACLFILSTEGPVLVDAVSRSIYSGADLPGNLY